MNGGYLTIGIAVLMTLSGFLSAASAQTATRPAAESPDAQTIVFQFKPVPGEVLLQRMTTNMIGQMKMSETMPAQRIAYTLTQHLRAKCLEVRPDGSSRFEFSLPRMAMTMNMGGMKLSYDSQDPPPKQDVPQMAMIQRLYDAITRIQGIAELDASGQPLRLDGFAEGMKKALEEVSRDAGFIERQLLKQMTEAMNEEMMLESMKSSQRMVPPDNTARIGDEWSQDYQIKLPMNFAIKGDVHYQLEGVEEIAGRRCARIRTRSTITMDNEDMQQALGGQSGAMALLGQMQFNMSSSGGEGVALYDYQKGEVVDMKEIQRFTIEIEITPEDDSESQSAQQPMKITQKLTNSVHMALLDPETKEPVLNNEQ